MVSLQPKISLKLRKKKIKPGKIRPAESEWSKLMKYRRDFERKNEILLVQGLFWWSGRVQFAVRRKAAAAAGVPAGVAEWGEKGSCIYVFWPIHTLASVTGWDTFTSYGPKDAQKKLSFILEIRKAEFSYFIWT